MTVAPTAGIAPRPLVDAYPNAWTTCSSCGRGADAREPFCSHCGSRVAVVGRPGKRLASLHATRALQLAVLVVVANILLGGVSFGVVYLVADAARLTEAALGLEAMRWLAIVALAVLAIRAGVRGIRDTADGTLGRRAWAVLGISVAGLWALLVSASLVATTALFLLR